MNTVRGNCRSALQAVLVTVFALAAGSVYPATERQFENHTDITRQIGAYLAKSVKAVHGSLEVRIETGSVDSSLRLRKCDKPLQLFMNARKPRSRSITVGVRCAGRTPWLIYVSNRVFVWRRVIVARKLIKRGQTIYSEDLQMVKRETGSLTYGYIDDLNEVVGKKARRMILPGNLVRTQHLGRRYLVKLGTESFFDTDYRRQSHY